MRDQKNLGFESSRITLTRPGGYTSIYIFALVYQDQATSFKVKILSSSWEKIKDKIIPIWEKNQEPAYQTDENGLFYTYTNPSHEEQLKKALSSQLGATQEVPIEQEFTDDYDLLTSPYNQFDIGSACYYAGTVPEGRRAIVRYQEDLLL